MDLFIIRHGQSGNNALSDIRTREVDPPLTDLGQQQARVLAEHLANGATHDIDIDSTRGTSKARLRMGFGITSLFSSPMYRSLQTVQPVGKALGLAPRVWTDLHEEGGMYLNHGGDKGVVGYPGRTRTEILDEFPDFELPDGITEHGWWNKDHEDPPSCAGRAIKVSQQLLNMAESNDRVALVTHGLFMGALLKALLNQLPGENIYYRHHNTGITRFSIRTGGRVELRYMNRINHLDPKLVS
ncbi:MAG: histidine phosphatase family protein [Chloroflexi bacterium]|nr:histidine phosphatase family protein [Chloroflexota bacterium]